jgi:ankyrin repeat protein
MRRDEKLVAILLAHGADANAPLTTWTPTRRASQDFNFQPPLVGASPFWLAARVTSPAIMRLLIKQGADPRFVHHADYYGGESLIHEQNQLTAIMAAVGMGGRVNPWVPPGRSEREALTLEAVQVAVDSGVDVNARDLDGRTALDAARTAKLESVVKFLTEKGAKSGKDAK